MTTPAKKPWAVLAYTIAEDAASCEPARHVGPWRTEGDL